MKETAGEKIFRALGDVDPEWLELDAASVKSIKKKKPARRRFVLYEIKKLLCVRYLWVLLAVLFVLNTCLAFSEAGKSPEASVPYDTVERFFAEYRRNTEEFERYYAELEDFRAAQEKLMNEAFDRGDYDYVTQELPNRISDNDSIPDSVLFAKYYAAVENAESYPDTLKTVIGRAKDNLTEYKMMGLDPGSYTLRYQEKIIEIYENALASVHLGTDYSHGWNSFFSYSLSDIFIIIMIVLAGSVVFAQEKYNGILPILRTARFGRARTALAKLLAMLLFSSVQVLLFTFSSFAVFGLRLGYSSPGNALQSLPLFRMSPCVVSIGEYFALTLLIKLLVSGAFAMIVLLVSVLFYNYVLTCLTGFALYGVSFLLRSAGLTGNAVIPYCCNLISASEVTPLFGRYRAANCFGHVVGVLPLTILIFSVLFLGAAVLAAALYARGRSVRTPAAFSGLSGALSSFAADVYASAAALFHRVKSKLRRKRSYSTRIFAFEAFKTVFSSRLYLVLILLLCLKVAFSAEAFRRTDSFADSVYKEYASVLEGEVTEEKLGYIAAEREKIDSILSVRAVMAHDFERGAISEAEYSAYQKSYSYAVSHDECLRTIEEHADYLLKKEAQTGIRGWFLYDTGWLRMFRNSADLLLYTSVLLLLCGLFASEYVSQSSRGSFVGILRTTKHGRGATFAAKLRSSVVLSALLAVVFNAVDLVFIFKNYSFPAAGAPLISIELFKNAKADLDLLTYTAVFFLLRVFSAVLLSLLVSALSELLCRHLPILGTVIVLTLLPAVCVYFGFAAADKVNFLNLLAGTPILLLSFGSSIGSSGFSLLFLWCAAFTAIIAAMLYPARKKYVD